MILSSYSLAQLFDWDDHLRSKTWFAPWTDKIATENVLLIKSETLRNKLLRNKLLNCYFSQRGPDHRGGGKRRSVPVHGETGQYTILFWNLNIPHKNVGQIKNQ